MQLVILLYVWGTCAQFHEYFCYKVSMARYRMTLFRIEIGQLATLTQD